jgi:hypothetical protein
MKLKIQKGKMLIITKELSKGEGHGKEGKKKD